MSEEISGFVERWGVNARTVKNWLEKGEEVGEVPPLGVDDPEEFLEWYRVNYGREPVKGVKEAARRIREECGVPVVVDDPVVDLRDVALIRAALGKLGLSLNLARVIEEEERAYGFYDDLRKKGRNLDAALRRWKDAGEIKRQLQKSPDAVEAALELLKDWVREEFEVKERESRSRVSGAVMGREAREALMETTTEAEWERVWDRELGKALRMDNLTNEKEDK